MLYIRHPEERDRQPYNALRADSRSMHSPWEPARRDANPQRRDEFDRILSTVSGPTRERFFLFLAGIGEGRPPSTSSTHARDLSSAHAVQPADLRSAPAEAQCPADPSAGPAGTSRGELVGYIGLSNIVRGAAQGCTVGYWIGAPFARRGYMSTGLALVLDHAFGPMGLHRVEANVQPTNTPSRRVVENLGFREEGFSPRYLRIADEWADHVRYAILAEEWHARTPD